MRWTLAIAAILGFATTLPAQKANNPFDQKLTGDRAILHAIDRLSFGPRPGDIEAVKKMGLKQWIDLQLHPERIPADEALETLANSFVEPSTPLALFAKVQALFQAQQAGQQAAARMRIVPNGAGLITGQQAQMLRTGTDKEGLEFLATLGPEKTVQVLAGMPVVRDRLLPLLDPDLRKKVIAASPPPALPGQILAKCKVYRAIGSERQLEEVLADFWYNHFNVDAGKGTVRLMLTAYDRESIRPHVLGKFRDLLEATANSPAMMLYLDNAQSKADGLNENYARELMELHTLGVNGGYTQHDIIEVARCFTGWTTTTTIGGAQFVRVGAEPPAFRYDDSLHDKGEKTVLGVTIPAGGGKEDGEKVLDILARTPSTARFISRELAQRFVADDPPPALIERMAATFHDTEGDITAVLSTMFNSQEFLSQGAYRSKIKTPFEMIVSAVRATGAKVESVSPLENQLSNLGEPLYRKLEPTGYSITNDEWVNSTALLARMNFALQLGQNKVQGVQVEPAKFPPVPAAAARQLLFTNATSQTLGAINKSLEAQKKKNPKEPPSRGLIAGLVIGSPDFQRR